MKHESRVASLIKGHEDALVRLAHHADGKLPEHVDERKLCYAYEKLTGYMMVPVRRTQTAAQGRSA